MSNGTITTDENMNTEKDYIKNMDNRTRVTVEALEVMADADLEWFKPAQKAGKWFEKPTDKTASREA